VLDCFNDLVADFRVFYRVDSLKAMGAMSADEFFALANRCMAYEGAVRWTFDLDMLRHEAELEQAGQPDRLIESGGEVVAIPVGDSYLYDLLRDEEMAHA